MSSANKDNLTSWVAFFYFCFLIAFTSTGRTALNRSWKTGHLWCVWILVEKLKWLWHCLWFFLNGLYYIEELSLYTLTAKFFKSRKDSELCQMLVLHWLRWLCHFIFYSVISHIDWLALLTQFCMLGKNTTLSWCIIFMMNCCMCYANILFRILALMFISDNGR